MSNDLLASSRVPPVLRSRPQPSCRELRGAHSGNSGLRSFPRRSVTACAQLTRRQLLAGSVVISAATGRPRMAAASSSLYEAWVKGDPKAKVLGDCPFCHRVLLTLEEKDLPYSKEYVDFAAKPEWLFSVNKNGSVPVVKDLSADKWLVDSAGICDAIESAHPEHKLGSSDSIPPVAESLFPSFKAFLESSGPDEDARRSGAYVQQLEQIQDYLKTTSKGPYLGGQQPSAADMALGPKLYHSTVALKHFKGFETPNELAEVPAYLSRLQGRQSWKNTFYSEDQVIAGWAAH